MNKKRTNQTKPREHDNNNTRSIILKSKLFEKIIIMETEMEAEEEKKEKCHSVSVKEESIPTQASLLIIQMKL